MSEIALVTQGKVNRNIIVRWLISPLVLGQLAVQAAISRVKPHRVADRRALGGEKVCNFEAFLPVFWKRRYPMFSCLFEDNCP